MAKFDAAILMKTALKQKSAKWETIESCKKGQKGEKDSRQGT